MARPVNATPERTRRRVLDTARSLFAAHGPEGASIRDVARSAGVSLATVHHHFGSKQGLVKASIDEMYTELEPLTEQLSVAAAEGGTVADVLDRVVRACFAFARGHRPALRLILRTVLDTGELDPEHRDRQILPALARGSELLAVVLGQSPQEVRLKVQSFTHLVVRYALTEDRELALIAGTPGRGRAGAERGARAVCDHLVDVAMLLFGIARETGS